MFLSRVVPLTVVVSIGCTSADVLRLDQTLRPQTYRDSVQLIAQEPQQPYKVIALISVRTEWNNSQAAARDRLLKEAARLGGDAVLLDAGSLTRVGTGGEYGGTQLLLTGKVIVFDREAARSN